MHNAFLTTWAGGRARSVNNPTSPLGREWFSVITLSNSQPPGGQIYLSPPPSPWPRFLVYLEGTKSHFWDLQKPFPSAVLRKNEVSEIHTLHAFFCPLTRSAFRCLLIRILCLFLCVLHLCCNLRQVFWAQKSHTKNNILVLFCIV